MKSRIATVVAVALAATAVVAGAAAFAIRPGPVAPDFGDDPRAAGPGKTPSGEVPPITAPLMGPIVTFKSSAPEDVARNAQAVPKRLAIPAIGLSMRVVPKGLADDGSMALPDKAAIAAWYQHGAVPGEDNGAALIAAHIATPLDGIGPFSKLSALRQGDEVTVTLSDGSHTSFVVVERQQIAKDVVDYDEITADSPGMLVLVTCGGQFDSRIRHYEDNVIVWAVPAEVP